MRILVFAGNLTVFRNWLYNQRFKFTFKHATHTAIREDGKQFQFLNDNHKWMGIDRGTPYVELYGAFSGMDKSNIEAVKLRFRKATKEDLM